tara:strand:- start:516 stop:1130 length:615 start_codon:yes stop_codon:yes gene_type:complete
MAEETKNPKVNVAILEAQLSDGPSSDAEESVEDAEDNSEKDQQRSEADFALKLVETLVGLNDQVISNYELSNRFFTIEELICFGFFAKSVPLNPLSAIYPENGFLLFKGVPVPKSVNLTSSNLAEIERTVQSSGSTGTQINQLSDLAPDMLNAYQMATQIYNDRLSKIAATYMANVKNAKTQVIEVSAAVVCGFVIILTLASLI